MFTVDVKQHNNNPNKNDLLAADIIMFGIIFGDCLFILIMVYGVLIRIALIRRFK